MLDPIHSSTRPAVPEYAPARTPVVPKGSLAAIVPAQSKNTSLGGVLGTLNPQRRIALAFAANIRTNAREMGFIGARAPSLSTRFKEFGKAQLCVLGLMALATSATNYTIAEAMVMPHVNQNFLVALSGPSAEKIGFLIYGVSKVPKNFARDNVAMKLVLGAAIAAPAVFTDVFFHDTAYLKLVYEGLKDGTVPEWLVASGAWGVSFVFAVLAQHAVVWGVRRLRV